jgi:hypothetical protein
MIHIGKILLFWFAAFVVAGDAADTTDNDNNTTTAVDEAAFSCGSICADTDGLSTPDLVVGYNWNSRVPVCAGKSCESDTCSALERKLPSFFADEADCKQHQTGLQEAGCECSGGSLSFGVSTWWIAVVVATATTVGSLELLF